MFLFGRPNVKKMEAMRDVQGLLKALVYWKDDGVRRAAAEALGRIGDSRAVEPLIFALEYESEGYVRRAAAEALGKIGDACAVEPLVAALKDGDSGVREAAAEALDQLGWQPTQDESAAWYWIGKRKWEKCVELGVPAVEPLITLFTDIKYCRNENVHVRKAAAEVLGQIGDTRAVKPLIAALTDLRVDVRRAAAEALVKIGAPAVEPLIAMLRHGSLLERRAAVKVLGKIGDTRAVEPLIAALKDELVIVRYDAAEALDKLGWQPVKEDETAALYWSAKKLKETRALFAVVDEIVDELDIDI